MLRRHWLAAGLGIVLVAGGCRGGAAGIGGEGGVVLRVVGGNGVATDWTLSDLEQEVEFAAETIDGDEQLGPRLLDVLRASGAGGWEVAEVLGLGEGRTLEVSLIVTAAEVDQAWMLDVTNRGTLKLATRDLPRERWVRDVGEIRIR